MFLLLTFIVIISSFLLFNVNYSKAYRVKNKVITALEQYEGYCVSGSKCFEAIRSYEDKLGYGKKDIHCNAEEEKADELGYCYIRTCKKIEGDLDDNAISCVYEVRTEVDMQFPLIREMMGIIKFKIHGKTKAIVEDNDE